MITIADSAVEPLLHRLSESQDCEGIRIRIKTVGCSGLSYVLEYSYKMDSEDIVIHDRGITLVIDPKSMIYLAGSVLEYRKEGLNEGFKFINPNATSECGCGESFHVGE